MALQELDPDELTYFAAIGLSQAAMARRLGVGVERVRQALGAAPPPGGYTKADIAFLSLWHAFLVLARESDGSDTREARPATQDRLRRQVMLAREIRQAEPGFRARRDGAPGAPSQLEELTADELRNRLGRLVPQLGDDI